MHGMGTACLEDIFLSRDSIYWISVEVERDERCTIPRQSIHASHLFTISGLPCYGWLACVDFDMEL